MKKLDIALFDPRVRHIVAMALRWAYCPSAGSYKDGASLEDCCEDLANAVERFTGVEQTDEYLTEDEVLQLLYAKLEQAFPRKRQKA